MIKNLYSAAEAYLIMGLPNAQDKNGYVLIWSLLFLVFPLRGYDCPIRDWESSICSIF